MIRRGREPLPKTSDEVPLVPQSEGNYVASMGTRDDSDETAHDSADENEAEESESEPASVKPAPRKAERKPGKRSGAKARRADAGRGSKADASARPTNAWTRPLVAAAVALAVGLVAGWFGHDAQAKAKLRAEAGSAASGSSGACGAWQQKVCEGSGDSSAACEQAKIAVDLLTTGTCEVALAAVPATLAKVKAARASCDTLVTKLCNDLPKGSNACKMVTDKTPSLPPDRCKQMLDHYDDVLGQLKSMDEQGGPPMGGRPHPGPPPGAMPRGAPPQ